MCVFWGKEASTVSTKVSKKERLLWISVLSATIVFFVLVILKYQTTLTSVNQKVTGLESAKTTWTQKEAILTSEISDLKDQAAKGAEVMKTFPTSDPVIAIELERKGIKSGTSTYRRPVKT